jgi:hypothetical protein
MREDFIWAYDPEKKRWLPVPIRSFQQFVVVLCRGEGIIEAIFNGGIGEGKPSCYNPVIILSETIC